MFKTSVACSRMSCSKKNTIISVFLPKLNTFLLLVSKKEKHGLLIVSKLILSSCVENYYRLVIILYLLLDILITKS